MKMKIASLMLGIMLLGASPVFAYTLLGGKHSDAYPRAVIKSGLSSIYNTPITDSLSDWNTATNSPLAISLQYGGGGEIYFGGADFGNTDWNAQCTNFREFIWYGDYTTSSIEINYYHMDDRDVTWNKSTISHEVGHALGLDHTNDAATIMYHTGNPARTVTTPQTDDINGINYLY